ncbi:CDP-glycerol--poly(glycerophosphate) glycerophosphotransferase [Liquorilactobacillus vini]|uniref:CDP-glycerol:poly(Glycerophosphate) glycerophosphotransferase n=1 Tax=Liquorilactobacillus vini DSM 20605 TaxID=1133569 RepID=A0A0A7RGU7_9LACO|nr:CDP-glycerol--poly(glycerophosphate) glycerophosphotransferase [Liquorilactobacillus vini]AJA34461.1 CDP-glycerol:poly(glycerophosphate) glycerophosphotransferase [Liquorilactobacillus vini DSM 20605]KRM86269.1 hypothetical protein FD21_GL001719 [Liquorilactobacillus vini DSM 20605]
MIFLKKKKKILDLLNATVDMVALLEQEINLNSALANCMKAIEVVADSIEGELDSKFDTVFDDLQVVHDTLQLIYQQRVALNLDITQKLQLMVVSIRDDLNQAIPVKLNIAFMPYKVTMWDSLASIYEAAKKDPACVAKVIPIPYYQLTKERAIPTYEGKLFPQDVPVTSYQDYNLAKEEPDIIFIHNAYDQFNTITRVDERFFTSNLKRYTDMLVYVPYHITGFGKLQGDAQYITYAISTIKNIDKIVVAGQFVKDAAVKYGIPAEKVLVLGSPKMDAVYNATKKGKTIPKKWEKQLQGRFVFALDTNCMYLVNDPFNGFAYIQQVFDAARMLPNCAVIWRPHPLTRISIIHYIPQMLKQYDQMVAEIKAHSPMYPNIVFDDGPEYLSFFNASDAYISQPNSLMALYTVTEKPIVVNSHTLAGRILLPEKAFYQIYDSEFPWHKIANNLVRGIDPKKSYRLNLASQIYSYTDGTSGETIYREIKREVILKTAGETK